jgi:hypothetical protein
VGDRSGKPSSESVGNPDRDYIEPSARQQWRIPAEKGPTVREAGDEMAVDLGVESNIDVRTKSE